MLETVPHEIAFGKHISSKSCGVDRSAHKEQSCPMEPLDQAAARLEALGSPVRLTIYRYLVRAGDAGRPVGAIQEEMGMAASTLSHHLKLLESVDLIARRKEGTTHYCSARYATMDALIGYLTEECCVDAGGHAGAPHPKS